MTSLNVTTKSSSSQNLLSHGSNGPIRILPSMETAVLVCHCRGGSCAPKSLNLRRQEANFPLQFGTLVHLSRLGSHEIDPYPLIFSRALLDEGSREWMMILKLTRGNRCWCGSTMCPACKGACAKLQFLWLLGHYCSEIFYIILFIFISSIFYSFFSTLPHPSFYLINFLVYFSSFLKIYNLKSEELHGSYKLSAIVSCLTFSSRFFDSINRGR